MLIGNSSRGNVKAQVCRRVYSPKNAGRTITRRKNENPWMTLVTEGHLVPFAVSNRCHSPLVTVVKKRERTRAKENQCMQQPLCDKYRCS